MGTLKSLLGKAISYFNKAPVSWGIAGGVNAMMDSRRQTRQKIEQRREWESRYYEISQKHNKSQKLKKD